MPKSSRCGVDMPRFIAAAAAALTVLASRWLAVAAAAQYFHREADILGTLRHVNVVNVFGSCVDARFCLVLELCEK